MVATRGLGAISEMTLSYFAAGAHRVEVAGLDPDGMVAVPRMGSTIPTPRHGSPLASAQGPGPGVVADPVGSQDVVGEAAVVQPAQGAFAPGAPQHVGGRGDVALDPPVEGVRVEAPSAAPAGGASAAAGVAGAR